MAFLVFQIAVVASLIGSERSIFPFTADPCAPCTCPSGVLDCRGIEHSRSLTSLALREIDQLTGLSNAAFDGLEEQFSVLVISTNHRLTGSIPAKLGQLSSLMILQLDGNQLTGSIPAELGQLSNLLGLRIEDNQLTGSIPVELGRLSKLAWLNLDANQLTGSIPVELGRLSKLAWLDLYKNQLTGSIPAEFGQLSKLRHLWLNDNHLTGSIPAELAQLSNLEVLWLHKNQLAGPIPAELGRLKNLEVMNLSSNRFTAIPTGAFEGMSSLTHLYFWNNTLTCADIGNLPSKARCYDDCTGLSSKDVDADTKSYMEWYGIKDVCNF